MINTNEFQSLSRQISPIKVENLHPSQIKKAKSEAISFAKEMASAYHKIQNEIVLKEKLNSSSYYEKYLDQHQKESEFSKSLLDSKAKILEDVKRNYDQNLKLQGKKSYEASSATYIAAPLDFKSNFRPKTKQENPIYYNFLDESINPYNKAIKMMQAQRAYEPFKLSA